VTAQNVLDRLDYLEDVVVDGLPVDPGGGGTTTSSTDTVIATTGEPSIALQNAITAGGIAGASIVLAPGIHNWTTIPTIPPGITGRLRIMGAPGAVVRLSAIAPRFIDFGKTADYDEFKNIETPRPVDRREQRRGSPPRRHRDVPGGDAADADQRRRTSPSRTSGRSTSRSTRR
jgi:hypothetical protein